MAKKDWEHGIVKTLFSEEKTKLKKKMKRLKMINANEKIRQDNKKKK